MQQIKIHDHQFSFKSGGNTHALARVESFKAQGKTLTLADCTNAYQAIDQNALIHSLQLNGVNSLFVDYRTYLDTRSFKYADKITSGCPAGSSMAFAGALTDVITAMEAKGYQHTVFADDIQISHDQNVDKDVVLQKLAALLQPLGLELALNKCSSTQDEGEITFLGQTFSQSSTISLAERMTAKIDDPKTVLETSTVLSTKRFSNTQAISSPLPSQTLLRRVDQRWSCPHYTTTSCKPSKKQFLMVRHLQSFAERTSTPSGSPWSTGYWIHHQQFHLSD
ncbi:Reverse_transcriptase (RNA-dependent DNA polymerase) [Hexamita inflata]|uniref:Reverse transcriptase (RNA-dependent DNA polymerase) n=1 Tax=Hexamita inflata TaxID=28002 RepID=A0AA86TGI9_9EUKA|nr:Reverse transcriptase (RNA-dependent DNA polymerase) [Hexamita inflata]